MEQNSDLKKLEKELLSLPPSQVNEAVFNSTVDLKKLAKEGGVQLVRLFGGRLKEVLNDLDPYEQGRAHLFHGRYEEAKLAFMSAMSLGIEVRNSHMNLGAVFVGMPAHHAAQKTFYLKSACFHYEMGAEMGDLRARLDLITLHEFKEKDETLKQLQLLVDSGEEGIELIFKHAKDTIPMNPELSRLMFEFLAQYTHMESLELLLGYYENNSDGENYRRILNLIRMAGYEIRGGTLYEGVVS